MLKPVFSPESLPIAPETPLGRISLAGHIENSRGIGRPSMRILGSYALVLLLNGGGFYADANCVQQEIRAGDLLLIFPDLPHSYGPSPGDVWDEFYVVFEGPVFDLWRQHGLISPLAPVVMVPEPKFWLKRLEEAVSPVPETTILAEPERSLHQVCRLQEILTDVVHLRQQLANSPASRDTEWLARARALLEHEPRVGVPPLDGPAAARVMQMPYESFRKKFTELSGVAPGQYRLQRLMERAGEWVLYGHLTNKQIADRLGFCDEFHFSRQFKRSMGLSPREWKKKA